MLAASKVIRSWSDAPITAPILFEGGRRLNKKNALEEDQSDNWGTTFWSN